MKIFLETLLVYSLLSGLSARSANQTPIERFKDKLGRNPSPQAAQELFDQESTSVYVAEIPGTEKLTSTSYDLLDELYDGQVIGEYDMIAHHSHGRSLLSDEEMQAEMKLKTLLEKSRRTTKNFTEEEKKKRRSM